MARLWTPEVAAKCEALYESKGVVFHRGARVKRVVAGADGRADGVELEDGAVCSPTSWWSASALARLRRPSTRCAPPPIRSARAGSPWTTFAASGAGVAPRSVFAVGDVAASRRATASPAARRRRA